MFAKYEAHEKFLAAVKASLDAPGWRKVSAEHAQQVANGLATIGGKGWSLQEATLIVSSVGSSAFDDESKSLIISTTTAMASQVGKETPGAKVRSVACAQVQENLFFHRYLTESEWSALLNPAWTLDAKLPVIVNRSKLIGLFNLIEKTALHLTCLLILASGKNIDAQGAYDLLQQLEGAFKRVRLVKGL